jgi:hypothetical protein
LLRLVRLVCLRLLHSQNAYKHNKECTASANAVFSLSKRITGVPATVNRNPPRKKLPSPSYQPGNHALPAITSSRPSRRESSAQLSGTRRSSPGPLRGGGSNFTYHWPERRPRGRDAVSCYATGRRLHCHLLVDGSAAGALNWICSAVLTNRSRRLTKLCHCSRCPCSENRNQNRWQHVSGW